MKYAAKHSAKHMESSKPVCPTQTKEWSRLGLAQIEQTSSSHILWQTLQYFTSRRRATKAAAKFSV